VVKLAYPIVISMLSMSVMGVMDTLYMGWLGTSEQAAVGLTAMLTFSMLSIFTGTWTAVTTFVAQAFGADRKGECATMVWQAGYAALVGVLLVELALVPLVGPLLGMMGADADVVDLGHAYLVLRLHGALFVFVEFIFSSYFRGLADMKTPMKISLFMMVLNIPFTYVLAFGLGPIPALGVVGAALGTVLSQAVGAVVYLVVFFGRTHHARYQTRVVRAPHLGELRRFLRIGLPIGVTWLFESGGWALFTVFVAGLGREALAAHTIVMQILHLSFMPGVAIGMAATTLVGQYLGAEDVPSAERSIRSALVTAMSFMGMMGLFFLAFRTPLAFTFNRDPVVVDLTRALFIFAAVFQIFDALGMVTGSAIRGAGDTRWPMVASLTMVWGLLIPGVFVIGRVLDYGLIGAWAAATAFITTLGLTLFMRMRSGRWKTMRV